MNFGQWLSGGSIKVAGLPPPKPARIIHEYEEELFPRPVMSRTRLYIFVLISTHPRISISFQTLQSHAKQLLDIAETFLSDEQLLINFDEQSIYRCFSKIHAIAPICQIFHQIFLLKIETFY